MAFLLKIQPKNIKRLLLWGIYSWIAVLKTITLRGTALMTNYIKLNFIFNQNKSKKLRARLDPSTKIFFSYPGPSLVLTRSGLILAWNLNKLELKSTYNTFILFFSNKMKLLIFKASINRNEQQQMIGYRFFSLSNQL